SLSAGRVVFHGEIARQQPGAEHDRQPRAEDIGDDERDSCHEHRNGEEEDEGRQKQDGRGDGKQRRGIAHALRVCRPAFHWRVPEARRVTCSTTSAFEKGFVTKASTPIASAALRSLACPLAVSSITGKA